jgi:hypothetical protein
MSSNFSPNYLLNGTLIQALDPTTTTVSGKSVAVVPYLIEDTYQTIHVISLNDFHKQAVEYQLIPKYKCAYTVDGELHTTAHYYTIAEALAAGFNEDSIIKPSRVYVKPSTLSKDC